jgi:hypothetical protein
MRKTKAEANKAAESAATANKAKTTRRPLSDRVAKLERSNRRLRRWLFTLTLMLVIILLVTLIVGMFFMLWCETSSAGNLFTLVHLVPPSWSLTTRLRTEGLSVEITSLVSGYGLTRTKFRAYCSAILMGMVDSLRI